MKALLNLPKGTLLTCINETKDIEKGVKYSFVEYEESIIPINNYQATMAWYPDRAIWTPEEYEVIRYKFMRVKLADLDEPQFLKDFEISNFTD